MDKTNFTTTCHFLSLCTRQRDHHFQIVFTWTIDKHRVPFGFIFAKSLSVSFVDKRARHHHPGFGLLVSLINAEPASVSLHKAPFGASSLCAPTIHVPLVHTDASKLEQPKRPSNSGWKKKSRVPNLRPRPQHPRINLQPCKTTSQSPLHNLH